MRPFRGDRDPAPAASEKERHGRKLHCFSQVGDHGGPYMASVFVCRSCVPPNHAGWCFTGYESWKFHRLSCLKLWGLFWYAVYKCMGPENDWMATTGT